MPRKLLHSLNIALFHFIFNVILNSLERLHWEEACSRQLIDMKFHYENKPMQYTEIFKVVKNEDLQQKFFDIFLIFAQNIDCGYTLEPRRGGLEQK